MDTSRKFRQGFTRQEATGRLADYCRHPTPAKRAQIVEGHQGLVEAIAASVHARLPDHADRDDIISEGNLGLLEAIKRFNPSRGAHFWTFATFFIKGRIGDWLRQIDTHSRLSRFRHTAIQAFVDSFQASNDGCKPTEDQIRAGLKLSKRAWRHWQKSRHLSNTLSLDVTPNQYSPDMGRPAALSRLLDHPRTPDVQEQLDAKEYMTLALGRLHGMERAIIHYLYRFNFTMAKVGQLLRISESRVSQVHDMTIKRLRAMNGNL